MRLHIWNFSIFQIIHSIFFYLVGESKHLGLWIKRQKRQYTRYIEGVESLSACNLLFPLYDKMSYIYKMVWFAQPFYTGRMKIISVPIDLSSSCYSLIFPYFLFFLCNLERGLLRAERVVRLQQLVDQGLLSWTFPEPYKKGKNVFFEFFF